MKIFVGAEGPLAMAVGQVRVAADAVSGKEVSGRNKWVAPHVDGIPQSRFPHSPVEDSREGEVYREGSEGTRDSRAMDVRGIEGEREDGRRKCSLRGEGRT